MREGLPERTRAGNRNEQLGGESVGVCPRTEQGIRNTAQVSATARGGAKGETPVDTDTNYAPGRALAPSRNRHPFTDPAGSVRALRSGKASCERRRLAMADRKERRKIAEEKALSGQGFNWVEAREKAKQRTARRKTRKKLMQGKNGTGYGSRNSYLKNMGYASYADYLKSDLWSGIKARVFEEKGRECLICRKPAVVLHHLRYHYEDLEGKTLENIVPLCNGCHHDCEFVLGIKVTLQQAREAYMKKSES